jgi:hypothetical protein
MKRLMVVLPIVACGVFVAYSLFGALPQRNAPQVSINFYCDFRDEEGARRESIFLKNTHCPNLAGWWNPAFDPQRYGKSELSGWWPWLIGKRSYTIRDLMGRNASILLRWLNPISTAEAGEIKGQKIDLTIQQARQIQQAIASLNQYNDNDGKPKFYTFSPVATLVLAKDGLALDQALRPVDVTQKKMLADAGGQEKLTGDALAKFEAEKLQPFLDTKMPLELFRLKMSDLNVDKQPIRPAVVQALLPILDDDTK